LPGKRINAAVTLYILLAKTMASQTLNRFRLIDCLLHNVHRAVLQLYPGREKKINNI